MYAFNSLEHYRLLINIINANSNGGKGQIHIPILCVSCTKKIP